MLLVLVFLDLLSSNSLAEFLDPQNLSEFLVSSFLALEFEPLVLGVDELIKYLLELD